VVAIIANNQRSPLIAFLSVGSLIME
jgi:hypothetical protein